MSREHRRPLLAFVLVTLLCALVVGNSLTLGSKTNRTLAAEVRAVVIGKPDDAAPTAGVVTPNDLPQGGAPLATTEPWLPFGTSGSTPQSSEESVDNQRSPQGVPSGVAPGPGATVAGPTLSGDAPPLAAPPLPESSPSASAEPIVEPELSPEPEPLPEPEPAPEPEPSTEPQPAPEPVPTAEPTPEPVPEPDPVLTFDDITAPAPAPEPVVTEPTTAAAPISSTDGITTP